MINQRTFKNHRFTTLAEIKAVTNGNEQTICYCDETARSYRWEVSGAAYTANDDTILITGAGGNTRWVCDPKLATSISDGDTMHSPDGNTIYSALALKAPLISPSFTEPNIGVANGTSLSTGSTTYASREITSATGGVLNINLGNATGDNFTIDGTKFVVEGPTGRIGIGTSTPDPDSLMHMYKGGANRLLIESNSSVSAILLRASTKTAGMGVAALTGGVVAGSSHGDLVLYAGTNADFIVSDDSYDNQLFIIKQNGRVGILEPAPDSELEVNGTIHATNLNGGAINCTVNASGQIIRDPSDERLKIPLGDIDNPLEKVLALKGRKHAWTPESGMGDGVTYSLFAQDMESVDPTLVVRSTVTKDTFKIRKKTVKSPLLDKFGREIIEEIEEKIYADPIVDNQMGGDQKAQIALLVEAIKEQNKMIVKLKKNFAEKTILDIAEI